MPTRTPARSAPPARVGGSFNLGDNSNYGGQGGQFDLPPGDYALEAWTEMFTPTAGKSGRQSPAFPAVMVHFHPLDGSEGVEPKPLGLGTSARKFLVPSSDSKGFDAIAGQTGKISGVSNWKYFRESLINACPEIEGMLQNDVTTLNGLWVRTDNIDEPAEKKQAREQAKLRNAAGEAAGTEEANASTSTYENKVLIVAEVLDGGIPWENGGGLEDFSAYGSEVAAPPVKAGRPAAATRPVPTKPTAPAKVPARGGKPAPPPPPAEEDVEDIAATVSSLAADFFAAKPEGAMVTKFKVDVFQAAKSAYGEEIAQAVQEFNNDPKALEAAVGEHGYKIVGRNIQPAVA